MNKKFGNIKKIVHIDADKKAFLWNSINEKIIFYEKNVRIHDVDRLSNGEGQKTSHTLYPNYRKMFITIITGLSIILTGGAGFAAEHSLPGEFLYPVKIHINENLESAFTLGAEAEAKLQIEHIEERIEERNKLEAKGELTLELDTKIESQIESHKNNFEKEKQNIGEENKGELTSVLELRLSTLLSAFQSRTKVEAKVNSSNSSEISESENNINSNNSSNTNVNVNAESNTDIDTNSDINTTIDATSKIKGNLETEVSTGLDAVIDILNETKADIDTNKKQTTDTVNDINVESDISIGSNTDSDTSIGKDGVNSMIESTTSVKNSTGLGIK